MQSQRPDHPSRRRIGIVTGVLAASLLGAGAVAAQSPSPSPAASASTGTPTTPSKGDQRHMPAGGRAGGPWTRAAPAWGAPGQGRPMGQWRAPRATAARVVSGQGGQGGHGLRTRAWVAAWVGADLPQGPGGRMLRRAARSSVTVSAIAAPVITLTTDDGWTRDIDTTGITITRLGQDITLADVHVGDDIRLGQTRNADGTWTVNQLEVLLAGVQGAVASVAADSFTVTAPDDSVVTVRVADTTRWIARRGTSAGLDSLTVGAMVIAEGVRAADGSIDAIAVGVRGRSRRSPCAPASPSPSAARGSIRPSDRHRVTMVEPRRTSGTSNTASGHGRRASLPSPLTWRKRAR